MSSAYAIAGVTAVLQHYFQNALNGVTAFGAPVALSAKAPDLVQEALSAAGAAQNQINLFMHQVTLNPAWRNVGMPTLGADGRTVTGDPPLALDLHYLLTAYGSEDCQAEALLGHALLMIHRFPTIARADITSAFAALPATAFSIALNASGLADQIELIKMTPSTLGREEMAWLWTALKADYRPTFPFQVSVVLLQPQVGPSFPLPVLSRGIVVHPIQPAQLSKVMPPNRQLAAAPGDVVTVEGQFLKDATSVVLASARLGIQVVVPATAVTAIALQFTVPVDTPPVPFPAGIYTVAVRFEDPGGAVLASAGTLPLAVCPILSPVPAPVVAQTAAHTDVTVAFVPDARPNQKVSLAIGSRSTPAPRFTTNSGTLTFRFEPALPSGPQLMRLEIDGAPSQIVVDWLATPPVFKDPLVTI